MSSCCIPSGAAAQPCPKCGHIGPIVGVAPVRPHVADAGDCDWQHCANRQCEVVYHLNEVTVDGDSVITQVGLKGADKAKPVCFCFGYTAEAIGEDLAEHDGVSRIKLEIKAAVADGLCACEHLNPSGNCCLADVHRTIKDLTQSSPA